MWTRFIRKYSVATKNPKNKKFFAKILGASRGQAMLEYLFLILMGVSMFMLLVRPHMMKLEQQLEKGMKGGIFNVDASGSGYYYFPVK